MDEVLRRRERIDSIHVQAVAIVTDTKPGLIQNAAREICRLIYLEHEVGLFGFRLGSGED